MDRILAIIPVHNRRETTLGVIKDMMKLQTPGFVLDVLVIDDGSTDGTAEAVGEQFPRVKIERGDGNLWWGGALNVGFRYALKYGYDYVYTLNDDIVLQENTLSELYKAAICNPKTVCGSVVLDESGRIINAGFMFGGLMNKLRNPLKLQHYELIRQNLLFCDTLSSQSTLIPSEVLRHGIFVDERRFPHNYSDLNFFDTVRKRGFRNSVVRLSVIQAEQSSSDFHTFIIRNDVRTIVSSFFRLKYAHNLSTQWNIASNDTNPVMGSVRFVVFMWPYIVWFSLRCVLPKKTLVALLVTARRRAPCVQKARSDAD